ncbi:unnamed protein product [Linum tenue]|uniref:Uncharacterized protein n=1 Tax=Linum tenue TaxID=586396 RepID=A0AAV0PPJ4_9ROSI|nr:unnamed protein product [Linum tenue]
MVIGAGPRDEKLTKSAIMVEIKKLLLRLAGPLVTSNSSTYLIQVTSLMFVVAGWSIFGNFVCFGHQLDSVARNGQCNGNLVRPSLWGKAIPFHWHPLAESHAGATGNGDPSISFIILCSTDS